MRNRDFSNLGRLISRAARQAMRSQDLGEIRNTVNNTFNEVVQNISRPEPEPQPPLAEDITLDMLSEHEERLCMLEITTNAV